MFQSHLIVQDSESGRISEIYRSIVSLADASKFRSLRVAVAYASLAGCKNLSEGLDRCLGSRWKSMNKEWMISVDFGRTDADALEFLSELPKSSVRIPNGLSVLQNKLIPKNCFHPKMFAFGASDAWSGGPMALFCGSANLTLSGLHSGTEQGISLIWKPPLAPEEEDKLQAIYERLVWWLDNWKRSVPVTSSFLSRYRKIRPEYPREDDSLLLKGYASAKNTEIKLEEGLLWGQARCLWVQTHKLYKNLGKAKPGNQVDLRRGTRVYFGLGPQSVSPNTVLGQVILQYKSMRQRKCSVRFGDNSMDKVNLPVPGKDGPRTYDNTFLHFERIEPGLFRVRLVRDQKELQIWRKKSQRQGLLYIMSGGRQFGLYS